MSGGLLGGAPAQDYDDGGMVGMIEHGGVLRYIDRHAPVAYFCEPDAWGDDWNDAPWEHNAERPTSWITRVVYLDSDLETPGHNMLNSPWSVDDINKGAVAWLSSHYGRGIHIPAGATVAEFVRQVGAAGGIALVVPEDGAGPAPGAPNAPVDGGAIHACPPDGSGIMPCCGRQPTEVPRTDRITVLGPLVTCGGRAR